MKAMLLVGIFAVSVNASDVSWTRFKGSVKQIDLKANTIQIQDNEGNLVKLKVDEDVMLLKGKETVLLSNVGVDEKVTLVYMPRPPKPKDTSDEPVNGIYPPIKR